MRDLFDAAEDICRRRHRDNLESASAHESISGRKKVMRSAILGYLASRGSHGATVEEISDGLGIRYTTASARVSELKRAHHVRQNGCRQTSTGRKAGVVVVY